MAAVVVILADLTKSAIACTKGCFPARNELIETATGTLLICGFALIGLALPSLP
jgi:hypothetical protein